jgi:hypothetical protein
MIFCGLDGFAGRLPMVPVCPPRTRESRFGRVWSGSSPMGDFDNTYIEKIFEK